MAGQDQWIAGYICAAATLVRQHGDGTAVRDMLGCITLPEWNQIEAFDREILAENGYISEPTSVTAEPETVG